MGGPRHAEVAADGVVRSLHRGGPGASTLMRRQLRAEEDAAAVEGDVGCVVLLSVVGDPHAPGRFSSGPGLEASYAYASARWVVLCGCRQTSPTKMLGAHQTSPMGGGTSTTLAPLSLPLVMPLFVVSMTQLH